MFDPNVVLRPHPVPVYIDNFGLFVSYIDEEDGDLRRWMWSAHYCQRGTLYVRRLEARKPIYLHRVILARIGPPPTEHHALCDHVDGNGLNNRRSNLRWVTHSENAKNIHRPSVFQAFARTGEPPCSVSA